MIDSFDEQKSSDSGVELLFDKTVPHEQKESSFETLHQELMKFTTTTDLTQ